MYILYTVLCVCINVYTIYIIERERSRQLYIFLHRRQLHSDASSIIMHLSCMMTHVLPSCVAGIRTYTHRIETPSSLTVCTHVRLHVQQVASSCLDAHTHSNTRIVFRCIDQCMLCHQCNATCIAYIKSFF